MSKLTAEQHRRKARHIEAKAIIADATKMLARTDGNYDADAAALLRTAADILNPKPAEPVAP